MTVPNAGRLLFVVTRNHGSLIDTMLFLHGTDLLERSVILLPPELFATHETGLKATVREYNSFADLVQWIDAEQPAVVFLFCGYLLMPTGLLSASELKRLLRLLEDRGCAVLTNDPCWGLLASRIPMTSELPGRTLLQRLHRAFVEWFIPNRLRQSYQILKDVVHCYPTAVDPLLSDEGLRTAAYFNTKLLEVTADVDGTGVAEGWTAPTESTARPSWLFILASVDYDIQVNLHGRAAFIDSLVARLRDASESHRRAVLIAPTECLAAVRQSEGAPDVTLISFCGYQQYISTLLTAEYVFYWNIASSSSLYRLFNGLPVFYFDQGHVSRWFRSFFDRTVELMYRGHTPTIMDHRERLVLSGLQSLARTYEESARDIVRQLRRLPRPEELVAGLATRERAWSGRS